MGVFRRAIGFALAAGFSLGAYWSARLALADRFARQGTVETVRRAAVLAPDNAEYLATLSDWQGAIARNPYDSRSLIRAGLDAEGRGHFGTAERTLLQAAAVDRLYEPRWTLANFYLRRQNWDAFWKWSGTAAQTSPEAPLPLYRLCREATPDFGLIFERVIEGRPRLVESFLYWLDLQNDLAGLRAVLPRAVEAASPKDAAALTVCASRTLRLGGTDDALRSWNRMIERGLLPFNGLDPERGASLTNGNFGLPLKGETFNWTLGEVAGLASRWPGDGSVQFEFSGKQPEDCELLSQELPVLAGRRYRLAWKYRTSEIADHAGPVWLAGEFASKPLSGAEEWSEADFEFETLPGARTIRLALAYRRVPGTTRIRGVYRLSDVRLGFAGK